MNLSPCGFTCSFAVDLSSAALPLICDRLTKPPDPHPHPPCCFCCHHHRFARPLLWNKWMGATECVMAVITQHAATASPIHHYHPPPPQLELVASIRDGDLSAGGDESQQTNSLNYTIWIWRSPHTTTTTTSSTLQWAGHSLSYMETLTASAAAQICICNMSSVFAHS